MPLALLSDHAVQLAALKKADKGGDLIVRLFEPTGRRRRTTLTLPFVPVKIAVTLGPFEIKTLRVNPKRRVWREVNLVEEG